MISDITVDQKLFHQSQIENNRPNSNLITHTLNPFRLSGAASCARPIIETALATSANHAKIIACKQFSSAASEN